MANLDFSIAQLTGITNTEITNKIKSITKLSSVIKTSTKNYNDFSTKITDSSTTNNYIINMSKSVNDMNDKLTDTSTKSEKAGKGLLSLAKSALSMKNVSKGMDIVDKYINSSNSLARMNGELQDQMELQNQVNAAATRSGLAYGDMVEAVSNIGTLDTFKDNDQAIAFTEVMQKTLKIEGSDQSISDVTKSLSDGILQGDEFTKLIADAPKIGEALSASSNLSMEQLKKMADQGLITADVLKKSMFAAGNDISAEFSSQPKTFADIMTQIKNSAMNALSPLMQLVSDIINNPGVQAALNVVISLFGLVSQTVASFVDLIKDNWPLIQSILIAAGIYLACLGAIAFVSFMKATVAELAILMPIILIIGALAGIIFMLQSLGVSFEDIFGFIGGVVGVAVAGIYNLFIGLFELVLGIINYLVNPFLEFGNFIANFAKNPISSIIYLFQGMADNVLGVIETIASALDFVFGTKMADTVSGWRTGLKDMADTAVETIAENENYQEVYSGLNLSVEDFGLKRMEYGDAWNNGVGTGKDAYSGMENMLNTLAAPDSGYDYNQFDTDTEFELETDKPVPVVGTVDMEDEDLDYLRKMAERDYIANIATNTLAPNISVSFGDVHETADVNQLFGRIRTILQEQIAVAPEGVY